MSYFLPSRSPTDNIFAWNFLILLDILTPTIQQNYDVNNKRHPTEAISDFVNIWNKLQNIDFELLFHSIPF